MRGTTSVQDPLQLLLGSDRDLVGEGLYHLGSLQQIGVLEQIGLVGQDLLGPERPLLVPRRRQPQGLVPRGELHRPGSRILRQRHRQHLEQDAVHVVLRLDRGQAERVHLHPVAEPPELGIGHAVALGCDAVPQSDEGPHLAGLLDEPNPGVAEEGDAPHELGKILVAELR